MKQSPWDWKKLEMRLQALMDAATESGEECGCQLAIYWNGQQVLSLVSGYTTPERSVKIDEQSLFPVFSVGKGIMATAFHRLREKGKISCDTRVADLWPEFGCCGKENIRVRDILTHREALFELPEYGRIEELADWELMCRRMEKRTPAWPREGNAGIIRSPTHGCSGRRRTVRTGVRFHRSSGRRSWSRCSWTASFSGPRRRRTAVLFRLMSLR